MGVKGLWNYVEHHNIQYAYPNKSARAGCYGIHPRHLFIDMNAVMHISYEPKTPTTAATLRAVAARVDELLAKVRPQDVLVLVFDGVAPSAKLRTQKERRRSLAVNAPRPASTINTNYSGGCNHGRCTASGTSGTVRIGGGGAAAATSGTISAAAYTCDLTRDGVPLHREEILCGSEFVLACEEYMTSHLQQRKSQHSWRKLQVCGCRTAGEGEVKISGLLRQLWATDVADGTYTADDAITFIGNDSDLILVAMVATPYRYLTLIDPFDCSLTSLHELMEHWSNAVPNPPLSAELLPSYRVDFVFLMLLAGDDYYEGIRADSVALWRRYRHLRANEGFFRRALLSGPDFDLDVEFLRALFQRTGSMSAQMARVPRNKRKTAKSVLRSGTGGGGGGGGNVRDGVQLLSAALWSMRSYVAGHCGDYRFQAQQDGCPSVGALRAASQARGLAKKIGAGPADAMPVNGETGGETSATTAVTTPLFTPLEQCVAVLGVRGRYSMELRRAIELCTPDEGHALTTSFSITYVAETVRAIMAAVDEARLTKAERWLRAPSALRVELTKTVAAAAAASTTTDGEAGHRADLAVDGGVVEDDEGAFMRLAMIPSRKTTQGVSEKDDAREAHADANAMGRVVTNVKEDEDESGEGNDESS